MTSREDPLPHGRGSLTIENTCAIALQTWDINWLLALPSQQWHEERELTTGVSSLN